MNDRDRTVISQHIKNLFNDGELIEKQVCAKNARTGPDGKNYWIDYYNFAVLLTIISPKEPTSSGESDIME